MNLFESWSQNTIYSKRNYSMATNPATERNIKFNIRIALAPERNILSARIGSSYVFGLKSGDEIKLIGPFGDFLVRQSDREKVYLGGGAGMAPLRSHLSYLFETEKTNRKVSFWYGAHSVSDIFYDEYFKKLEVENENFSFHIALSERQTQDAWEGPVGFIPEVLLNEYLIRHDNPQGIEYYLCGPPTMIKAGLKMLEDLAVPDQMISFDEF